MKACTLKNFGGTEQLEITEVKNPVVKPDEVLIKTKAIGIDQIDLKTRRGQGMAEKLKEENPMILGWDIAGEIIKTGNEVKNFKAGDTVFGTVNFPGLGNTYAEYVAVPASQIALKPENISFEEAAGATQSPLTAWQALIDTGHIKKGDKVLIHGASGGVGNYAVQIAKHTGAYVIATASGPHKDFVMNLGADEFIDYRTQRFEERMNKVDFILDPIGGDNFIRSLEVLKPEGIIVLLPSDKKEAADRAAQERNIKNYYHILMHSSGEEMKTIARLLKEGNLKSYIAEVFPFDRIQDAHKKMESGGQTGKIVVTI